jgi:hypothetical protein
MPHLAEDVLHRYFIVLDGFKAVHRLFIGTARRFVPGQADVSQKNITHAGGDQLFGFVLVFLYFPGEVDVLFEVQGGQFFSLGRVLPL